jgi:hypothetical protein
MSGNAATSAPLRASCSTTGMPMPPVPIFDGQRDHLFNPRIGRVVFQ